MGDTKDIYNVNRQKAGHVFITTNTQSLKIKQFWKEEF